MRTLHISPHPGDLLLACPATLRYLSRSEWQVVDFCPNQTESHKSACRIQGVESWRGSFREALGEEWDLIISPDTLSGDPDHERIARQVRDHIEEGVWWRWAIWSHLQNTTLVRPLSGAELSELKGRMHLFPEPWRPRLLRSRAELLGIWAGHAWPDRPIFPFAEALSETIRTRSGWRMGERRILGESGSAILPKR